LPNLATSPSFASDLKWLLDSGIRKSRQETGRKDLSKGFVGLFYAAEKETERKPLKLDGVEIEPK